MNRLTLDHLPRLPPRPAHATDHTGERRGKMTAIAWCRSSRSGKGTVWLCRCSCGRYEYRRPGRWQSRPFPDDQCDVCLHAQGPNARHTASARLQQWTDRLLKQGLTEREIEQIRAPGAGVETRGRTVTEIREQLARERP